MSKPKRKLNVDFRPMDDNSVGLFDELARMILLNDSNPYLAILIKRNRKDELALIAAILLASWAVDNPKKSKSILGFSVVGCEFTQVLGRLLEKMVISKNRGAA